MQGEYYAPVYPNSVCPYSAQCPYMFQEQDVPMERPYTENVDAEVKGQEEDDMYRRPPFGPPFWGPRPPFWGPRPPFFGPRPPFFGPRPPFFGPGPFFGPPFFGPRPPFFGLPFLTGLTLGGLLF